MKSGNVKLVRLKGMDVKCFDAPMLQAKAVKKILSLRVHCPNQSASILTLVAHPLGYNAISESLRKTLFQFNLASF